MHRRPSMFKACVFLFAATAAAVGVAQAADSKLDSVLARGKLIVGTGSTNAPWHFQERTASCRVLILISAT